VYGFFGFELSSVVGINVTTLIGRLAGGPI
jgi:hypothetical protein